MAIAALVCGILGFVGGWIPGVSYIAWIFPIAGIVLGVKARKDAQATGQPTGMATAGMVLGIISLAFTVLAVICVVVGIGALASMGAMI